MLGLLVVRALTDRWASQLRTLTFIGASVGLLESTILFFVQWLDVKAFCTWCLASGVATLGAWLFAWGDRPPKDATERLRDLTGYTVLFVIFVLGAVPGFLLLTRPELWR